MSIDKIVGGKEIKRGPSHRLESLSLTDAARIIKNFRNRTAYMIRALDDGGKRYYVFGVDGMK